MSEIDRRAFVATTGAGFLGTLAASASAQISVEQAANVRVVTDFCAAWSTRDFDRILPWLAEDSVYRMTETTPPAIGHAGVRERLGSWLETSDTIEFRILDTWAKGPMVVNHRIDRFMSVTRPLTWEGVGVFFVKDGKIKEWFDYTIRVERS